MGKIASASGRVRMRYTEGDLRFLAMTVAGGGTQAAGRLLRVWGGDAEQVEPHLDDDRVVRRLQTDQHLLLELSPRFLFSVLLRRIRRDLSEVPYTVERVHADGRIVVFDAGLSHELLTSREMFDYLVELLVSFERSDTMLVRRPAPSRSARRLNTASIDDMLELASLIEPDARPMVFRRIGDIALFTTGLFPGAVMRNRRMPLGATGISAVERGRLRLEDYEAEGRRFYRLAADRFSSSHPGLARVLMRLSDEFTAARKPLTVLSERYVSWARPHWTQLPS
jgi:hypothetical protein